MGICSIETVKLLVWKFDRYILFLYWVDANNVKLQDLKLGHGQAI
jgi:hypothetical protein